MEDLKNLNNIRRFSHLGIYKRWLYKKEDYMKICNYMQKISYSIQDLNGLKKNLNVFDQSKIVFCIVLVDWIIEAYNKIFKAIKQEVIEGFCYKNDVLCEKQTNYLKALRSFIVAHPLSTTRHKFFGLDGNYICVDIRDNNGLIKLKDKNIYYVLDSNGLLKKNNDKCDFYLYCYSDKDDNMKFFRKIGCNYQDIYNTAHYCIDKLYALDKYLSKITKKHFIKCF